MEKPSIEAFEHLRDEVLHHFPEWDTPNDRQDILNCLQEAYNTLIAKGCSMAEAMITIKQFHLHALADSLNERERRQHEGR